MEITKRHNTCMRCTRGEGEVRLFDGIYVTEPVKICEKCSLILGVPIIKKPSTDQLKDSEKPYGVRTRLMRLAGIAGEDKKNKSPMEELKELEKKPELEKPDDMNYRLVDNFHWIIQTSRRRKGLTAKQLGDSIAESESAIKMLESRSIPRNSHGLIKKIEQFLNIKLLKEDNFEKIIEREKLVSKIKEMGIRTEKLPKEPEVVDEGINAEPKKAAGITPSTFRREHHDDFKIRDLQRAQKTIDEDMEFSKKSKEEVGKEQMDGFGKEETEKLSRKVYGNYEKKELKSRGSSVPSIYDLMKKREEKESSSITGNAIEIIEDKSGKLSKEEWDELE